MQEFITPPNHTAFSAKMLFTHDKIFCSAPIGADISPSPARSQDSLTQKVLQILFITEEEGFLRPVS